MKYMTIKQFVEQGYLQELNSQFLHPLGLALEVTKDESTGEMRFGRVWDGRDDPDGFIFAESASISVDNRRRANATKIKDELTKSSALRLQKLGFVIQPL